MTDMGELKGPLTEAVGSAGYTLAVAIFDIMVRKGFITEEEARDAFRDWSERSKRLEGTANHDAATILSGLAVNFNVKTE
jgi:polyhydroxyalkanoate synthesis regulator phasin